MTDFKVGDRVRATLGENVLVGTLDSMNTGGAPGYGIDPEGVSDFLWLSVADGWQIEKVSPPLPTKVGAIVRTAGTDLRVLTEDLLWCLIRGEGATWTLAQDMGAPIEVIFEGVDQ